MGKAFKDISLSWSPGTLIRERFWPIRAGCLPFSQLKVRQGDLAKAKKAGRTTSLSASDSVIVSSSSPPR